MKMHLFFTDPTKVFVLIVSNILNVAAVFFFSATVCFCFLRNINRSTMFDSNNVLDLGENREKVTIKKRMYKTYKLNKKNSNYFCKE